EGDQASIDFGEQSILELEDLTATQHNGGALAFGPDGKLYVAIGDNLTSENAQDLTSIKGKILRIDPDGGIPTDNPFYPMHTGLSRTIWALGFRNPFTVEFQRSTGRFFANDVGLSTWEEIDEVVRGGNYGWPTVEGPSMDPQFVAPLYTYPHMGP